MNGYLGQIVAGLLTTVELALWSLIIAALLGFIAALAAVSQQPIAHRLTGIYASLIRGIPDLLLMLILFYGGQIAINKLVEAMGVDVRIELNQFVSGVITLGIIYGAYFMETFRGALQAIPPGQAEAARAFGMPALKVSTRILLPQMIRFALPGFTNNWLVVSKATALASVIGLQDMMYRAKLAGAASHEPFTWLLLAGALYLLITSLSLMVLKMVERRFSLGVRRGSHV